jgi:hypothetical protein
VAARSRLQKLESKLTSLEERFEDLLLASLRECERGHWEMFGTNDRSLEVRSGALAERLKSRTGMELLQLVESIDDLRTRLGFTETNAMCARYLDYRKKRGSNDLGEPKLATELLAEIEKARREP